MKVACNHGKRIKDTFEYGRDLRLLPQASKISLTHTHTHRNTHTHTHTHREKKFDCFCMHHKNAVP